MIEPIGFEVRKATLEDFLEDGYLSVNPDVRVAVAGGAFASGRQHLERYGLAEGRTQRAPLGPLAAMRAAKIDKLRSRLRRDMPHRERGGRLDFLTRALRDEANLVEVENVSSHNYDEAARGIIARHADGLVLDCGAGRRDVYYPNVVNYEIVDYDTTDVLGVGEALPFVDGAFDAVISVAVLEHVRDPFRCAGELARVLKPGGDLFCCVPLLQPAHGYPHHYFNATPQGLRRLFEAENLDLDAATLTPIHPIWAISWILGSWAQGLPEEARQDFEKLTVAELMVHPPALLHAPISTLLPIEKQLELACATILVAKKRERRAPQIGSTRTGTLLDRAFRYIRKSSPR